MTNIEELLERYFEGDTSAEEECRIRTFFASGNVPTHLTVYKPLFAYFDEEIKQSGTNTEDILLPESKNRQTISRSFNRKQATLYILSGVAACILALLSLNRLLYPADPCFCSDNYVVINGRCYTDIQTVRSLAMEALQEVATPADKYFPEKDAKEADRALIDNQLKELGSFFNDEE